MSLYIDYLSENKDKKAWNAIAKEDIINEIAPLLTGKAKGEEELLKILKEFILPYSKNLHSPQYMGHQVPPSLPLAVMLDMIISGWNQSLVVSRMSPVLSVIETELIRFFCRHIGYDERSGGTLTSGGSVSNLLGILAARIKTSPTNELDKLVIFSSGQAHYSVKKAAITLGLKKENVISLPYQQDYTVDVAKIPAIIEDVLNQGKIPFCLSANAGSTSTGSFDDLTRLSSLCKKYNIWFHVDAAHGGSLIFSDKLRYLLAGIEEADSISIDAHKMMFMPSSAAMCFFKEERFLKNCFKDADAPYLYNNLDESYDLSKKSLQCTRRGDALKIWGSLFAYGTEFFSSRQEYLKKITEYFYEALSRHKNFVPIIKPSFNIICFRYKPENTALSREQLNDINYKLRDMVNESGDVMLTLTVLEGDVALRATIINPATTEMHIDNVLRIVEDMAPYCY